MAGWSCSDRETIEWNGTIKVRKGIIFPDGSRQITAAGSSQWAATGNNIYNTNIGNVGIGTTSPTSILSLAHSSSDTGVSINFNLTDGTEKNWLIGRNNVANTFEITPSTLAGGNTFTTPVFVINSSGNVGIGTTNPEVLLSLGNPATKQGYIRLYNSGAISKEGNIYNNNTNGGLHMDTYSNAYPIQLDGSKVILGMTGNVGIGTTSPTMTLEVSGAIIQTGVGNIETSGAGVFKKNGSSGVGGTFTTADLKTVTVSGGIIISIV